MSPRRRGGSFWIHGHWLRERDRWRWRTGYYEHERPGFVEWRDGGWFARGVVVVRDRRALASTCIARGRA